MKAFLAKFSTESRGVLSSTYHCIWECDDTIDECRDCGSEFSFFWRMHHCRACCTLNEHRICLCCVRGLTPGKHILDYQTESRDSLKDRYAKASHIFECTTFIPLPKLTYGSLYDDNFVRLDETKAHTESYFQLSNRSEYMCAVKIVAEGSNIYNEISRPPFYSVLPRESVYADIAGLSSIYVILLYENPHQLIEGEAVVYESSKEKNVTPSCRVKYFGKYALYKIRCGHKNVLVKYKEGGALLPRSGTSRRLKYKAAGFLSGAFTSRKSLESPEAELDFSTNIELISEILV